MGEILNRLKSLRKRMNEEKIDFYIIPTNDYHGSEYVGAYFKAREYITGFTGSAGTALIMKDAAILWTDGRYFLQAEAELKNSTIELYKMGEKDVPTIVQYLMENAKGKTIGFDGKSLSLEFYNLLKNTLKDNAKFVFIDLIKDIWQDRPLMSCTEAFLLSDEYSGEARSAKLSRLEKVLEKHNINAHIITSLDDIAWLLNIRADDVKCNPVLLSYLLYNNKEYTLYVNNKALNKDVKATLNKDGIKIKNYDDIYEDIKELNGRVLIDPNKVNAEIFTRLDKCNVVKMMNPTTEMKCIKNDVEIKNSYLAHLKDGVAVTKFIYWLKTNVGKIKMTEISCAKYLENLRKMQDNYLGLSFETISGYDYHGAIIHYDPTEETDIEVLPKSFLLVDSGGQYLEGTTDITRTIAVGELSDEQKIDYTLVLKGHLALGGAIFKEGTNGGMLDMLARKPLWEHGLDYKHGTGHGVGHFLNVHEGPQRIANSAVCNYPFKKGMITSDEPGIYIPNKFGIRIENLMVCLDKETTEYGKFLKFDFLTVAPYEREAIVKEMLNEEELTLLNNYHKRVFTELAPYLNDDERKWLFDVTREI